MKKQLLTLSAVALLIVASCSKSKDEPTNEKVTECKHIGTSLVSSEGTNSSTFNFNYAYDSNDRISKFTYPGASYTYSYTTDKIDRIFNDGHTDTYNLASGRVVSRGNRTYSYNSDGYLIQQKSDSETTNYSYANGNVTLIDQGYQKYAIEYSTEVKNSKVFFYGDEFMPYELNDPLQSYFGKPSKNLIAKINSTGVNGNYTLTFSYTKDSNGNISKATVLNSDGSKATYSLNFECK